jgi:choice-of-anchor A domain-containing protein
MVMHSLENERFQKTRVRRAGERLPNWIVRPAPEAVAVIRFPVFPRHAGCALFNHMTGDVAPERLMYPRPARILPLEVACLFALVGASGCFNDRNLPAGRESAAVTAVQLVCAPDTLGVVQSFDVFVSGDLSQSGTDVGGSVAAGGNAKLADYSCGAQLPSDATRLDLLVGGNLTLTDGSAPNGAGRYQGTATITRAHFFGGVSQGVSPVDFGGVAGNLASASAALGAATPNGTRTINNSGGVALTGTDPSVNIIALSAADLAAATGVSISAPAGSVVIVNISGTSVSAANFGFQYSGATAQNTLFNLYEATSLSLSGIGFQGTILAPRAAVTFNDGQLNGQIIAASLTGGGEVEHEPFTGCSVVPAPDAGSPAPDAGSVCPSLGSARAFDLFVTGDLKQNATDVGGSVAAGGNATLSSYSAGTVLSPDATRLDLLVGGNINLTSVRVPNGAALYQGTATISSSSFFAGIGQGVSPIAFATAATDLAAASSAFSALSSNGTVIVDAAGGVTLSGTSTTLNVFGLTATQLAGATSLTITAPAGSTIVVNVSGASALAENFAFTFNGVTENETLFNFYQATTLTLSGIGFDGSILAPLAAVSFNNGQLDGQIFAASLSGGGEVEHVPFTGCSPASPTSDAGAPSTDAGTPMIDAGTPSTDAGAPGTDAGTPITDAGVPVVDAGTPLVDAGTPSQDAGTPTVDAGTAVDAGSCDDAGTVVGPDAGTTCALSLGGAQDFDLFVTGDLNQSSTDVGGSVAAGGNATLKFYAAGSQLAPVASRIDLLVGGNLDFNSSSVPNGAALYQGTATLTNASFFGGATQGTSPVDFTAAQAALSSASATLSALTSNGTVTENSSGALSLTGTSPTLNIFSITAAELSTATSLSITAPASSTVVVNVTGSSVSIQNMGFSTSGVARAETLFNFSQATTLTLSGIGLDGSILAPLAAVSFQDGQVDGQIFAASLSGGGEVEHDPFTGCGL